jgi:hypothetical protein
MGSLSLIAYNLLKNYIKVWKFQVLSQIFEEIAKLVFGAKRNVSKQIIIASNLLVGSILDSHSFKRA